MNNSVEFFIHYRYLANNQFRPQISKMQTIKKQNLQFSSFKYLNAVYSTFIKNSYNKDIEYICTFYIHFQNFKYNLIC